MEDFTELLHSLSKVRITQFPLWAIGPGTFTSSDISNVDPASM